MAILNRHLSWDWSQSTEAQQVVGRSDQVRVQLHAGEAAEACAAQAPVRLHPTEDLLDPLALLLADPVARMARGANVEPCSAASVNLRDVWPDGLVAQEIDERRAVVTLISPQAAGLQALAQLALHKRDRCGRLGLERRTHPDIEAQSVAVLHEGVTTKAQLRFLAFASAGGRGLRISRGGMRVVRARRAAKIHSPSAIRGWRRSVLGLIALGARPRLDQRAIHRQMLRRQQVLFPRHFDDRIEEALRQVLLHQPLPQAREVRLIEPDIV